MVCPARLELTFLHSASADGYNALRLLAAQENCNPRLLPSAPVRSQNVPPVCPPTFRRAEKKKGRPPGQPFHCRAVVRLNSRDDTVFRRPGPPERGGSSSRMPATAAMDNETLDHLL